MNKSITQPITQACLFSSFTVFGSAFFEPRLFSSTRLFSRKYGMLLFLLLFLFLFLAWWKQKQKTYHIEQKMFAIKVLRMEQKMFQNEQKMLSSFVTHYCMELTCMAMCGPVWPYLALFGVAPIILCSFCGLFICNIVALYRLSRGHRSKLIWSCLNAYLLNCEQDRVF